MSSAGSTVSTWLAGLAVVSQVEGRISTSNTSVVLQSVSSSAGQAESSAAVASLAVSWASRARINSSC